MALWKERNLDRRLTPEDFQITDSRYGVTLTLLKCDECGFIFAEGEETNELTSLYAQLEDPAYEDGKANRSLQMRWLLDRILEYKPNAKSLLDIGAGNGLMIAEANRRGLRAAGVEPSHSLAAAAQRAGLDVLDGTFPHAALAGRKFDILCLVDVIEHLRDSLGILNDCRRALAPNGLLVVVTPDVRSLAARLLQQRGWHFRLAHVAYFDRKTMLAALKASGFSKQKLFRARWFFPISYIAERLAFYLPIGALNRRLMNFGALKGLYSRVISVSPHDSLVVFAQQRDLEGLQH